MIIDDDDGPEDGDVSASAHVAGTAYRETITSVDGFTRGPNGKVKFNKDTKKRRREAAAGEDVEMADQELTIEAKKPKRRAELKLGHEFKAKVSFTGILGILTTNKHLFLCRKPEVMLRRKALTHMHTCHCLKPRKKDVAGMLSWVLRGQSNRNNHDFHVAMLMRCYHCQTMFASSTRSLIIHTRSGLGVSRRGLPSSSLGASIPLLPDRELVM